MAEERKWQTNSGEFDRRTKIWKDLVKTLEETKEEEYKQHILNTQFAEEHKDEIVDKLVAKNKYDKEKTERDEEVEKIAEAKTAAYRITQIEGINNEIELAAHDKLLEEQKEAEEKKRDKEIQKALKVMKGEAGFKGLIKTTKGFFHKLLSDSRTTGELWGELRGEFSADFGFIQMALAPLTSLPGISSALAVIKFNFLMLWKGIRMFWAWQKSESVRERLRERMASLRRTGSGSVFRGIVEETRGWFANFFTSIPILGAALIYMVWQFFKTVTMPFRFMVTQIGKLPGIRNLVNLFRIGGFFGKGGAFRTWIRTMTGALAPEGRLTRTLSNLSARIAQARSITANLFRILRLSGLFTFFGFLGRALGYFGFAIAGIIGAWQGLFDVASSGWIQKTFGAGMGAIRVIVDFFIFQLADLIKEMFSGWMNNLIGDAKDDSWRQKFQKFNFSDMWNEVWNSITDGLLRAIQVLKATGVGLAKAVWAIPGAMTGGETPVEAFRSGFDQVMGEASGLKSVSDSKSNAEYANEAPYSMTLQAFKWAMPGSGWGIPFSNVLINPTGIRLQGLLKDINDHQLRLKAEREEKAWAKEPLGKSTVNNIRGGDTSIHYGGNFNPTDLYAATMASAWTESNA